jgi:hypothetical protein
MTRRFQFSLKTLFIAMLCAAFFFGGIQFERERRRRADQAAAGNGFLDFGNLRRSRKSGGKPEQSRQNVSEPAEPPSALDWASGQMKPKGDSP